MVKTAVKKKSHKLKNLIFISFKVTAILFSLLIIYIASTYFIFYKLRLFNESIAVSGTGSMYPTFPKGETKDRKEQAKEIVANAGMLPYPNGIYFLNQNFFGHRIERGDIVTFSNKKTARITSENYGEENGFIKRVVALPGDTIEIRNGVLYLNNQPQKEPYTALPHSTFGGPFLEDCQKLLIPQGKLFVMGDNRKGSGDSRHELGLIDYHDIDHVLPLKNQLGKLDKNWRDTTNDLSESSKITINKQEYLQLLNEKRKEGGLKILKYEQKLEKSASKRAEAILKYNDFSFEATKSGYTQARAMSEAGYSNIIWGEAPLSGYYSAAELIENLFEQPNWKKFLLNPDNQDFGIAEVEGNINGCPSQVIVQHFAGYVPPNYETKEINSWKEVISNLKGILPGWAKLKEQSGFYEKNKTDVDRINELINLRIVRAEQIVKRMESNQWFTREEEQFIKDDEVLFKQIDELADKLNAATN